MAHTVHKNSRKIKSGMRTIIHMWRKNEKQKNRGGKGKQIPLNTVTVKKGVRKESYENPKHGCRIKCDQYKNRTNSLLKDSHA